MPELPEVETVKNCLNKDIVNKTISSVDVYYGKIIKNIDVDEFKKVLVNQTFLNVYRKGKYLIFDLNDYYMIGHLRMEGKYFLMKDEKLNKHDHVIFNFNDGYNLRYNDVRKFGVIYLFKKSDFKSIDDLMKIYPLNTLGYEPFDKEMTVSYLKEKLKNSKQPIKTALLDQSIISGLGNIYADEVCFISKLHPLTLASSLNEEDLKHIIDASVIVLNKAIKLGGTTIRSFQSSHEISGRFQNELCVHTKEYCQCGTKIEKIKVGGRGTYFCPNCQKEK